MGVYGEAADWAIKAAARPNAHQHIMAIAAKILERVPNYSMADFLAAFRYAPDAVDMFKRAGKKIGIS